MWRGVEEVNRSLGREYEPISESDDESESDRKIVRMMSGGGVHGAGETGSGLRPGGISTGIQTESHEWKDETVGGKGGEMGVEEVGKRAE